MSDASHEPILAERMAALRAEHPDPIVLPEPGPTGGRRIPLDQVQPGDMIWSKVDWERGVDQRLDHAGEPRGGIVLRHLEWESADTGEVLRAWHCFNPAAPWHRAFTTLTAEQVEPDGCETPDRHRLWMTVRRFCQHVVDEQRPTAEAGDLLHAALRLAVRALTPEARP